MTRQLNPGFLPLFAAILLSQLLTGCTIFTPKPQTTNNINTNQQTIDLTKWQLKGKLIFKSPEEKMSASLNWQQNNQHTDIRLTTFLGISILKLKQDKQGAKLEYDGEQYQAQSARQLLARHTNLNWPIEQMPEWIKGVSSTQGKMIQYDAQQNISQMTLLDEYGSPWQLNYPQYTQVNHQGKTYQLPKQVRLQKQNMTITIKISRWILD